MSTAHQREMKKSRPAECDSTFCETMDYIREISRAAQTQSRRYWPDFLADRIKVCCNQPSLGLFLEELISRLNTELGVARGKDGSEFAAFMRIANAHENRESAARVLNYIRSNVAAIAMIATLDNESYEDVVCSIDTRTESIAGDGEAIAIDPAIFPVRIRVDILSPLAHGGDIKAGNATLFRRRRVKATNGSILHLPFYAGNALRGQMRDALADHLLRSLEITPRRDNPPVSLWFFHALYAGGALEEGSKVQKSVESKKSKPKESADDSSNLFDYESSPGESSMIEQQRLAYTAAEDSPTKDDAQSDIQKKSAESPELTTISAELGKSGSIRSEGIYRFRNMLPSLSLLGCSMGNRILAGRMNVHDLRPRCRQWGTGDMDVNEIMDWLFLTRREDHEDHDANSSMIATTEVMVSGAILDGGIFLQRGATPIETGALAMGLKLLQDWGHLGAQNRQGYGLVDIQFEADKPELLEPSPYLDHLQSNREEIVNYLRSIQAIA